MGMRSEIASGLGRVIGRQRVVGVKRWEARVRGRMIRALDVEARHHPRPGAAGPTAPNRGRPTREERIAALGDRSTEGAVNQQTNFGWVSSDPFADYPPTTMHTRRLLGRLHRVLQPRTYFEIGINRGSSLTLSRTRTLAVDPQCAITEPINCDLSTVLTTSDDFFAATDAFDHFRGVPVDLALIDGMHLSEFAVRDFMNTEKHMAPSGVIVLDDMLPRNDLEAYRIRRTKMWSGDVYKFQDVLAKYRPDLTVIPLNTAPTGALMVVGLDPTSTVLDAAIEAIEDWITEPDPQRVPEVYKRRLTARDPRQVLALDIWPDLVRLRSGGAAPQEFAPLWARLRDIPTIYG